MANGRTTSDVVRVRNEILVALKMVYPAAFQAQQLLRSLLSVFPTLEWHKLRTDLCYLNEKGYLRRVVAASEGDERLTAWRSRWFRLTASGMEIADHLIGDPAMEE